MTAGRRSSVAVAFVAGMLLAGCGGEASQDAPSSYLVTDLGGGTAAPDAVIETPEPSVRPTRRPTRQPSSSPAPSPGPAPGVASIDGDALVALVAAAVAQDETVRVTIGGPGAPPAVEAAVVYGATDAFDASLTLAPGEPQALLRRVQGMFYAGNAEGLESVEPDDPRLATAAGGIIPAFLTWDPLLDLRSAIEDATDVVGEAASAGGVDVTTYDVELDVADLPQPSLLVPAGASGAARATLTLDADDLPVELRLSFGSGAASSDVVVGYSAWGERVQIEVPPRG